MIELASFSQFSQTSAPSSSRSSETIGVVLNTIIATMRTEALLEQSQTLAELQQSPEHRRRSCRPNAELEDKAKLLAEQNRDRGEERRDRARQARAGGAGRAARPDLALQVRVPRQHVARAAHAAEQPADPGQAARRERRRQPQRQAGRVRQEHLPGRQRPAQPDQRHPRPVQGRGGQDGHRARAVSRSRAGEDLEQMFRPIAEQQRLASPSRSTATPQIDRAPTSAACSRCSRTCCPTRSSSPSAGRCT